MERMLFCCGLRVSEARKLRLDMVDLENGVLKIYQSKGSNDRLVYLPEDLQQLCCECQLFFSKTNDFLSHYLPCQAARSIHTIETYRDGLTYSENILQMYEKYP